MTAKKPRDPNNPTPDETMEVITGKPPAHRAEDEPTAAERAEQEKRDKEGDSQADGAKVEEVQDNPPPEGDEKK